MKKTLMILLAAGAVSIAAGLGGCTTTSDQRGPGTTPTPAVSPTQGPGLLPSPMAGVSPSASPGLRASPSPTRTP